ncbi:MAG: HEAT repeat domain-containing protein [Acidimicrobiales bacterium]
MIFKRPKDPAQQVEYALAVLRQQTTENERTDVGTDNMPKFQRAKRDLIRAGRDVVLALVDALHELEVAQAAVDEEHYDDPVETVERYISGVIIQVLGEIGDPRAVAPLFDAIRSKSLFGSEIALAKIDPEGVSALLAGLDDEDSYVRSRCATGLGFAKTDPGRAAKGIVKALNDVEAYNRERAVYAARNLHSRDPELLEALRHHAIADDNERIREKAESALDYLS